MRILGVLLSLVLLASFVNADLTDGLYSYLPLDDSKDILGFAQTGVSGDASFEEGLVGNALHIPADSASSMIYFGSSINDRDSTYRHIMYNDTTINVWINIEEFDSLTDQRMTIMGGGPGDSESVGGCIDEIDHWTLTVRNVQDCNLNLCDNPAGSEMISFLANSYDQEKELDYDIRVVLDIMAGELASRQWYMVTVSHSYIENIWKIYFNGILKEEYINIDHISNLSLNYDCPYAIGNRPMITTKGTPFSGLIDEIGFWNRVLSDKEIEQLYNDGQGLSYPFETSYCGDGIVDDDEECDDGNKHDGDGCDSECQYEVDPQLIEWAPIIIMHPYEDYEARTIESMMNNSELKKRPAIPVTGAPVEVQDLDVEQSWRHYLDMDLVDIEDYYDLPLKENFYPYEPVVYGTKSVSEKGTHLQYYIFYPFQDYMIMNHEGDWELFQVNLNRGNGFESAMYYFGFFTLGYYDMDLLDKIGTHPYVRAAKGSHNNFASNNTISFPKYLDFFEALFSNLKNLEKIGDGNMLLPEEIAGPDDSSYSLYELKESSPIATYQGLWGQTSDVYLENGPKGPKYNPRFNRIWRHPDDYSLGPRIPFMAVFLFSPLDIYVYDENNTLVTEDSDKWAFNTGHDSEPEAVMLFGTNFTVNLTATGEGNFTLQVFYYHNDTNTSLMVLYGNVSNSNKTKASLDVSLDSLFELKMDHDGDGDYDQILLPDDYITMNDFVLPDRDSDSVNDFDDNCPGIPNDQSDFNDDGLGDACDNPNHYKQQALELSKKIEVGDKKEWKEKKLCMDHIEKSLREKFWDTNLSVNNVNVFVHEIVAAKHTQDTEILLHLARADKLLVEKRLLESDSRHYSVGESLYEQGNVYMLQGSYEKAMKLYMRAWLMLR